MEFEVDSRFNGRPIPQISSLIINQVTLTPVYTLVAPPHLINLQTVCWVVDLLVKICVSNSFYSFMLSVSYEV